jgi:tRNA (adenine57-N1/adenine58-N1)-methyltransferase catalytic subunit
LNIQEFKIHGLNEMVVAQHGDVCIEGFKNVEEKADCAFLDLPAPWDAIPHLPNVFTRQRISRVCCFSPCIEQVLSTHSALRKAGFTNIDTFTMNHQTYQANPIQVRSMEEMCDRLLTIKQRVKEGLPRESRGDNKKRKPEEGDGLTWSIVAKGETEINSHTSFLTFGELMPIQDESVMS